MRRIVFTVCTLLAVAISGLIWWIQRTPPPVAPAPIVHASPAPAAVIRVPHAPAAQSDSRPVTGSPIPPQTPATLLVTEMAELSRNLHSPDTPPREDLEILQRLLDFYRRSNDGANPGGGLNEEIVDKLRGQNAKHLAVLPPNHPSIDAQGQLLDRWGTPYFFHPISREVLDIRSAGPDRKLWTEDDLQLPRE